MKKKHRKTNDKNILRTTTINREYLIFNIQKHEISKRNEMKTNGNLYTLLYRRQNTRRVTDAIHVDFQLIRKYSIFQCGNN